MKIINTRLFTWNVELNIDIYFVHKVYVISVYIEQFFLISKGMIITTYKNYYLCRKKSTNVKSKCRKRGYNAIQISLFDVMPVLKRECEERLAL